MGVGFVEREACPVCRSGDAETLCEFGFQDPPLADFITSYYQGRVPLERFGNAVYRIRACPRCKLVYQDPVLNDEGMRELYEQWIDTERSLYKKQHAGSGRFRQYAGQVQTVARLFAERQPGEVRVLDYGMGWGYWSRMAQAHGFDVSGCELSAARRAHANGLGLSVIDHLPAEGGNFDFIFANQVFEHLPDPLRSMQQLVANLAPGGVIQVRVPDGRSVEGWLRQRAWSAELDAIHPLEHINCFTRRALLELAVASGLRAFNPPLRLNWGSLWGGLRREFCDRWLTTHLYLRRA